MMDTMERENYYLRQELDRMPDLSRNPCEGHERELEEQRDNLASLQKRIQMLEAFVVAFDEHIAFPFGEQRNTDGLSWDDCHSGMLSAREAIWKREGL